MSPLTHVARTVALSASALLVTGALVACGASESGSTIEDPTPAATDAGADGMDERPLVTRAPVTVLDSGDGPQMCATVLESMPPTCSGPELSGFDFADHPDAQSADGTTWGQFMLSGAWDGEAFAVLEAESPSADDAAGPETPATTCEDALGDAGVVDAAATDQAAFDAALQAASALPTLGYAWQDTTTPGVDAYDGDSVIINLAVVGGAQAQAEAEGVLREVWGGRLCIQEAQHTERDLNSIVTELAQRDWPEGTFLGATMSAPDRIDVAVWVEDGALQAELDSEYGTGLVRLAPTLVPQEG